MRTFLRLSVFECRQSLKKPLLWIAILPITAIILINMHTYLFTDFPMTDYEEFVHQIELRKEGSGRVQLRDGNVFPSHGGGSLCGHNA